MSLLSHFTGENLVTLSAQKVVKGSTQLVSPVPCHISVPVGERKNESQQVISSPSTDKETN